jgi:hypothetical protein
MVDVAVTSQLSQWSFDKPELAPRPQRGSTDSAASSPNLCDDVSDTLRIDTPAAQDQSPPTAKPARVFQERYLSSEEDLTADDGSGSESEYDYDDAVVHDLTESTAKTMSISRWDKGRSCDMAVAVAYAHAGRPKMVDMEPIDRPAVQQRAASVANLVPITAAKKLLKADESQRLSMKVLPTTTAHLASPTLSRPISPVAVVEPRRPSTSHSPITQKAPATFTDSASISSSFQAASTRSFSPAFSEPPRRPSSSTAGESASARSSVYMPSRSRLDLTKFQTSQSSYQPGHRQSYLPPPTPNSPALSFLSSDPYEHSSTSPASPIIKKQPTAHRRLRSISMKLSLAKIAISPAKKQFDSRVHGKVPPTPQTPQTAPIEGAANFAAANKVRRASTILRPKSRGGESARKTPTPDPAPPVPQISTSTTSLQQKRSTTMGRMTARGADEREPTLVLPPCPGAEFDPTASAKSRAIRRRKSLMDFMDSL